jgi:lipoprotein NlpD
MKKVSRIAMLTAMDRYLPLLAVVAASLLLAACGTMRSSVVVEPTSVGDYNRISNLLPPARTPIPGGSYIVAKGDTLYSIAFRKGVDFRDLAQWNRIAVPYTIWPGQRLTLSPSSSSAVVSAGPAPAPAAPSHLTSSPEVAVAPVFEPVPVPAAGPVAASTSAPIPKSVAPTPAPNIASTAHATIAAPPKPAMASTTAAVVPVAGVPTPSPAAIPSPAPAPAIGGISRAVSGIHWRWPADGSLASRFQSGDAIPGIEIAGKPGDPVRAAADGVVVYSGNGLVGYGELVIIKHNDSFLSAYGHNRKRLVREGQRVSAGQQIAEMGSTGASRNELEFQIRKDGNPVDPLGYLPPR